MMPSKNYFKPLSTTLGVLSLALSIALTPSVQAQQPSKIAPEFIDEQATRIMAAYQIPGMAIAIVENDEIVFVRGYGEHEAGSGVKVTPESLFKIASVSKNFTTAALALLVDEGKINWDDPVIQHLPEFKMSDPWVTKEFTIRDMLIHNSGLNLGAGDLMFWPEPNDFTRQDILKGLAYLPLTSSFRSEYAYDNLMYVLAGELTERVSGVAWEEFIEQRLLEPLGMEHCFAGAVPAAYQAHLAQPHALLEGKPQVVRRDAADSKIPSAPAGGIRCSASSLAKWMKMHLNSGTFAANSSKDGTNQTTKVELIQAKTHSQLWQPNTIMPVGSRARAWDRTHFSAYGLGWRLNDFDGLLRVHHTGSLHGMYSYMSFFPELDVGMVVLMNRASGDARDAMMYSLVKPYSGDASTDWLEKIQSWRAARSQDPSNRFEAPAMLSVDAKQAQVLVGEYQDPWFGQASVEWQDNRLQWRSHRSPRLVGELLWVADNTYVARWDDRTLYGDAYVYFHKDTKGQVVQMRMEPLDPATDFSFDYEDLDFKRVDADE